ncbi:hypothetical protein BV113_00310 [Glutamicibacter phage BIM BV-113]|nr:hypothetical protein BV113_00310 [Glutamicibacter phage BIM BV-113]
MTIQEILEAHQYEPTSYLVRIASCSCGDWADAAPAHLAKHFEGHRAHLAEVLEQHMREREADAWDKGANEVHISGDQFDVDQAIAANPHRTESSDG